MSRAEDLYNEGLAAFRQGDQELSRRLNEECLALARAEGDDLNTARGLIGLSRIAFRDQDHARLEALAEECAPIYARLPDRSEVTSPNHMLAESLRMHGRFDESRRLYHDNIAEAEELGIPRRARLERINLSILEVAAGNYSEAERQASEVLPLVENKVDRLYCLLGLGAAKAHLGKTQEATAFLNECADLLASEGIVLDPADQPVYDQARSLLPATV
jgi:hypothetical protein